jgi:predicted ATP-grasp superfamily ATP-dependent carboligase
MKKIYSIGDVREVLKPIGTVIGLGVTAFPRMGIVGLVTDYQILSIKESKELDAMRRDVAIRSVKRDFGGSVEKLNTLALLKHKGVQEYLGGFKSGVSLFVYKSSKQIEKVADSLGLNLLANRSNVRDAFEDKWEFRRIAVKAGVILPSGDQLLIDTFSVDKFEEFQRKLGEKLVFQITDYAKGGGIGTFFVSNKSEFDEFKAFVGRRREAGRKLTKLNITQYINGESASITGCVTKHGVLTSRVQRQIVDVPEVVGYKGRSGVFCGHDWGERYSEKILEKSHKIAQNLGEYMFERGYLGIFGVDIVVNHKTSDVWIVECNSRYTGAFPTYTMLQKEAGEIPMEAWHLLEHAGVDYVVDIDVVQKSYNQVKTGAQLILHNLERAWVVVRGEVRSGVYRIENLLLSDPAGFSRRRNSQENKKMTDTNCGIKWVREGYALKDVKEDNEFVLTDGVPKRNLRLKPGARLGRVLFKREVMQDDKEELQDDVRQAMVKLYGMYGLEKIKREVII